MENVQSFHIYTSMGKSNDWKQLDLTDDQIETLNKIGYSGSDKYGYDASGFQVYLNSIDPDVKYYVRKTRDDSGDFSEAYEVSRTRQIKHEIKGNIQVFEGFVEDIVQQLISHKGTYARISFENIQEDLDEKHKNQLLKQRELLLEQLKDIDSQL